jgi:hypothetical protein
MSGTPMEAAIALASNKKIKNKGVMNDYIEVIKKIRIKVMND